MDEVKIWALEDGSETVPLESKSYTDSEWLLEEAIVKNPDLLKENLALVGRQTPTDGGPLDLLGVDDDGRLVLFELKRGNLTRDAVAQILDYASDLESKDIESLVGHISEQSGEHGIDKIEDFKEWYGQDLESLRPLRMCLVGLGVDAKTERMVTFMANKGMDISLLTFHAFAHDGKTFLAKQVHVDAADAPPPSTTKRRSTTKEERMERLLKEVHENGVTDLFTAVRDMFDEKWHERVEFPKQIGLDIRPRGTGRGRSSWYARISHGWGGGRVVLVFYPPAVRLYMDEFVRLSQKIPFGTWSAGTGQGFSTLAPYNGQGSEDLTKGNVEAQFILTPDDWEIHKEELSALTKGVYEAWGMERLLKEVQEYGVSDLFTAVWDMFNEIWHGPMESPKRNGLDISLTGTHEGRGRSDRCARIDHEGLRGKVVLVFYPRAARLYKDEIIRLSQKIPFRTWPRDADPRDGDVEPQFILSPDDWEMHKEELYALTKGVYEAWEREQEGA